MSQLQSSAPPQSREVAAIRSVGPFRTTQGVRTPKIPSRGVVLAEKKSGVAPVHRMTQKFSELLDTFERSRRALPDTISMGLQFLEFEKLQLFKVSELSVGKTCFRFFSATSPPSLVCPGANLNLKSRATSRRSSYLIVDPVPTQKEWSQLLAKND